jgi:hypothetical protein
MSSPETRSHGPSAEGGDEVGDGATVDVAVASRVGDAVGGRIIVVGDGVIVLTGVLLGEASPVESGEMLLELEQETARVASRKYMIALRRT